jgi:hypothetical protein
MVTRAAAQPVCRCDLPTAGLLSYATLLYLGYLWPLWDAKRQTFADEICSTVVLAY